MQSYSWLGLTTNCGRSKFQRLWGVRPVIMRSARTFLLVLVTAVIFASVVPVADDPETAFNEIDTSVNQTIAVAPRIILAIPARLPIFPLGSFSTAGNAIRASVESISLPKHRHSNPLRELLCALLI
jgi:hypothetical protein